MTARPLAPALFATAREAVASCAVALAVCAGIGGLTRHGFFDDALAGLALGAAAAALTAGLRTLLGTRVKRQLARATPLPLHATVQEGHDRRRVRGALTLAAATALSVIAAALLDLDFAAIAIVAGAAAGGGAEHALRGRGVTRAERAEGRRYWRVTGGPGGSEDVCWTPVESR